MSVEDARLHPRNGGYERLSGKQAGDTDGARDIKSKHAKKVAATETKGRKQRASDVGRALRSIYDDTVRETVPDDFLNLLGKLS